MREDLKTFSFCAFQKKAVRIYNPAVRSGISSSLSVCHSFIERHGNPTTHWLASRCIRLCATYLFPLDEQLFGEECYRLREDLLDVFLQLKKVEISTPYSLFCPSGRCIPIFNVVFHAIQSCGTGSYENSVRAGPLHLIHYSR